MDSMVDLTTTPRLLVNVDKIKRNCDRMRAKCQKLGLYLRPNVKAHKTIEIAEIATGGTKQRISVSNLREAEEFANAGFNDILFTTPLIETKIPRAAALNERLSTFHTMLDSLEGVRLLMNHLTSKAWSVFIKLDIGANRAGIPSDDTEQLVQVIDAVMAASNITLSGLYFYDGHSYNVKSDMSGFIGKHFKIATKLVKIVKTHVAKDLEFSYGTTPSCSQIEQAAMMTELHPGAFAVLDVEHMNLGACQLDDIALKVATRVIGHYPSKEHFLIDCGFLALSLDGIEIESGIVIGFKGIFEDHDELRIGGLSQEIGKVKAKEGQKLDYSKYPIGSLLYIIPYHSCTTLSRHEMFTVINDGGGKVGEWKPIRGW